MPLSNEEGTQSDRTQYKTQVKTSVLYNSLVETNLSEHEETGLDH